MEKVKVMLDTSAYSAYLKGNEEIQRAIQEAEEIFLNPVVLGELLAGFMHGSRAKKNRDILEAFLASPRIQVAGIDEETSQRYAVIINYLWEQGTPIPTNDLWIAATAMQYGLKLVTTDGHYRSVPQIIVQFCNA